MSYKVVIFGASGLIGSNLTSDLLKSEEISSILSVSRKGLGISHEKLTEIVVDFDDLTMYFPEIKGDVIYSCLGTTKSETPNAELYRKIDFFYPLAIARAAFDNKVSQFHVVSSLGANSRSSSSYLKLKGELEDNLKVIGFKSLHIYRPSYLMGNRTTTRIVDKILVPLITLIKPLLIGSLKQYRGISASKVSKTMLNQTLKDLKGTFTYSSTAIQELA